MTVAVIILLFSIAAAGFGFKFFFSRQKFQLADLLLAFWFASIAVAQLRLSPWENPWPLKFWLILALAGIIFYFSQQKTLAWCRRRIKEMKTPKIISSRRFFWLVSGLFVFALASNLYLLLKFGTLPILSSSPDKMRFIINRQVFGLWEYGALLPRIFIPMIFVRWLLGQPLSRAGRFFYLAMIVAGFGLLGLYASRLVLVFPVVICYFAYLISQRKNLSFKRLATVSVLAGLAVLIIAVTIPAFRQYITYRDYYSDINYQPFTYLADLSQIKLPASLGWLIPLYLIPSFNLQALSRATDFFVWPNYYWGQYELSTFNPLLKIFHLPSLEITIPWKALYLPWWVTATFLFASWADFGLLGLCLTAALWGGLLAAAYLWAEKKPTLLSVLIFAYLGFVVIMSIYTNYFFRPEFYLDVALILFSAWWVRGKMTDNGTRMTDDK